MAPYLSQEVSLIWSNTPLRQIYARPSRSARSRCVNSHFRPHLCFLHRTLLVDFDRFSFFFTDLVTRYVHLYTVIFLRRKDKGKVAIEANQFDLHSSGRLHCAGPDSISLFATCYRMATGPTIPTHLTYITSLVC